MLKITPDPTFKADVKISVPGQEEPAIVKMVFVYKTRVEMFEFLEAQKEKPLTDTLAEVITDWEGFDQKYSKENLVLFLENYPAASLEIWTAYNKQLFESRVKN